MAFVKAKREAIRLLISLEAESGAGKTYSALLLARGLVGPKGKIAVLDTENKRSSKYADEKLYPEIGGFDVDYLFAPFTPDFYVQKISEAEEAGYDVLLVDSASHEWSGPGGCIEWRDRIDPDDKKGVSAWNKPKRAHKRYRDRVLQSQMHVILCHRAQRRMEEYLDGGKKKWRESDHMTPECERRFVFEFDLRGVIDLTSHKVTWIKRSGTDSSIIPNDEQISVATGERLAEWVARGVAVDKVFEATLAALRAAASDGNSALQKAWGAIDSNPLKHKLKPYLDSELKDIARRADEQAADAGDEDKPDDAPVGDVGNDANGPEAFVLNVGGEQLPFDDAADLEKAFPDELAKVPTAERAIFWDANSPLFEQLRARGLGAMADRLLAHKNAKVA